MTNDRIEYRRSLGLPKRFSSDDQQTVTIFVPDGYISADEFLKDYQFEEAVGEILCDNCEQNAAEAAYERQQEADLESSPETMREQQIRTWEEHKKAHKR